MANVVDIWNFHKGELLAITLLAKNPDGSPLSSPATTAVTMTLARTVGGTPFVEFSTANGAITLSDAPTSTFGIQLVPSQTSALVEGKTYYYNIWTGIADAKILQAKGTIKLINSVEPL